MAPDEQNKRGSVFFRHAFSMPLLGAGLGFFILHPLSTIINHTFEHGDFHPGRTIVASYSESHLPMAFFFLILGALFGVVYGLFLLRIVSLNRRLSASNRLLSELDSLKDEFMSRVTHELRTPLAAVRGSMDLVLKGFTGSINEEQRKYLLKGLKNVERLSGLIDNILEFEKLKNRPQALRRDAVDPVRLVDEVVEYQSPVAFSKGLFFKKDFAAGMRSVYADYPKIAQVLSNLINNALKFTDAGGVTVRLKEAGGRTTFSVIDTGVGIDRRDIPKLFTEFQQVGAVRRSGSTGLGLAICKKIIDIHKGEIWAESEPGRGSAFHFTLRQTGR